MGPVSKSRWLFLSSFYYCSRSVRYSLDSTVPPTQHQRETTSGSELANAQRTRGELLSYTRQLNFFWNSTTLEVCLSAPILTFDALLA